MSKPNIPEDLKQPIVFQKYQRFIRLGTGTFTAGIMAYLVLFHDFGEQEHCFNPIRRLYKSQLDRLWSVGQAAPAPTAPAEAASSPPSQTPSATS
eukprot:m.9325 g.9325  ORF g.9325 m.9325 type:complete len:95 (-) comp3474_c0_seq1:148-432(-)